METLMGLDHLHNQCDKKWRQKLEVLETVRKCKGFNDQFAQKHKLRHLLQHGSDINCIVDMVRKMLQWFPKSKLFLLVRKRVRMMFRAVHQIRNFTLCQQRERIAMEEALFQFWKDCEEGRRTIPSLPKASKNRVQFDPTIHPTADNFKRTMIHHIFLVKRRAFNKGYLRHRERYNLLRQKEMAIAEQLRKWANNPQTCIITDPKEAMERLHKLSDEIWNHQRKLPVFQFNEHTVSFDEMVKRGARMGISWVMKPELSNFSFGPSDFSIDDLGTEDSHVFELGSPRSLRRTTKFGKAKTVLIGETFFADDVGMDANDAGSDHSDGSVHIAPKKKGKGTVMWAGDAESGLGTRQPSRFASGDGIASRETSRPTSFEEVPRQVSRFVSGDALGPRQVSRFTSGDGNDGLGQRQVSRFALSGRETLTLTGPNFKAQLIKKKNGAVNTGPQGSLQRRQSILSRGSTVLHTGDQEDGGTLTRRKSVFFTDGTEQRTGLQRATTTFASDFGAKAKRQTSVVFHRGISVESTERRGLQRTTTTLVADCKPRPKRRTSVASKAETEYTDGPQQAAKLLSTDGSLSPKQRVSAASRKGSLPSNDERSQGLQRAITSFVSDFNVKARSRASIALQDGSSGQGTEHHHGLQRATTSFSSDFKTKAKRKASVTFANVPHIAVHEEEADLSAETEAQHTPNGLGQPCHDTSAEAKSRRQVSFVRAGEMIGNAGRDSVCNDLASGEAFTETIQPHNTASEQPSTPVAGACDVVEASDVQTAGQIDIAGQEATHPLPSMGHLMDPSVRVKDHLRPPSDPLNTCLDVADASVEGSDASQGATMRAQSEGADSRHRLSHIQLDPEVKASIDISLVVHASAEYNTQGAHDARDADVSWVGCDTASGTVQTPPPRSVQWQLPEAEENGDLDSLQADSRGSGRQLSECIQSMHWRLPGDPGNDDNDDKIGSDAQKAGEDDMRTPFNEGQQSHEGNDDGGGHDDCHDEDDRSLTSTESEGSQVAASSAFHLEDVGGSYQSFPSDGDNAYEEHATAFTAEASFMRRNLYEALERDYSPGSHGSLQKTETFLERLLREAEPPKKRSHRRRSSRVSKQRHSQKHDFCRGPSDLSLSPSLPYDNADTQDPNRATVDLLLRRPSDAPPFSLCEITQRVYTYFPAYPEIQAGPVVFLNPYDLLRQEPPAKPPGQSLWKAGKAWEAQQKARRFQQKKVELCTVVAPGKIRRALSSLKQ